MMEQYHLRNHERRVRVINVKSVWPFLALLFIHSTVCFGFVIQPWTVSHRGLIKTTTNPTAFQQFTRECSNSDSHSTRSLHSLSSKIDHNNDPVSDRDQYNNNNNNNNNNNSWVLFLCLPLWLVYISNQWSRSSIYYLVDFSGNGNPLQAMNIDLDFSQAQYGLLASVAFTSLFAIASLGAGVAADQYNRKTLTLVSVLLWSGATLGTSLSTTYEQVVLWRIAMGLACAFSTPTAYTLIQQRVPKDRTALASSFYGTGVALGGAFASLSILLDTELGWRQALELISVFGFTSAVLAAFLLSNDPKESISMTAVETVTNKETSTAIESISNQVTKVLATPRIQWLFLASFLRFCSGLMIGVWSAPYFRMVFSEQQSDYAVAQAVITAGCGVISGLLGGYIADTISSNSQGDVGRKLWVPVVGSLLAAPAWYMSVHSEESFTTAMTFLALEYFVAECWFGPTVSVLQSTVGPTIGGTAQGLFTVTGAVGNLAPSLLGFLYASQTDESSTTLANLLSMGICGGYVSSAACFAVASQCTTPDEEGYK